MPKMVFTSKHHFQNKVDETVKQRVLSMSKERASVADCLLLEQHAFERLHDSHQTAEEQREMLFRLMTAVSPKLHLSPVYKSNVFDDRNLAAQLPAHLTNFDVYNIATELRSHTMQGKKSSDNALDKFSNNLMFNGDNAVMRAVGWHNTKPASFSDPEQAFFGKL